MNTQTYDSWKLATDERGWNWNDYEDEKREMERLEWSVEELIGYLEEATSKAEKMDLMGKIEVAKNDIEAQRLLLNEIWQEIN